MKQSISKKYQLLLFSCLLLAACQKEIARPGNLPVIPILNTTDSNYIDKIIYLDSAGIMREDSLLYQYDNLKRLVAIADTTSVNENETNVFYYNSTDTLPYKAIIFSTYPSNLVPGTITHKETQTYLYYNTLGKRIKDSVAEVFQGSSYLRIHVKNYSYAPGKIYAEGYDSTLGGSFVIEKDTATTDAQGNIVSNTGHRYLSTSPATENGSIKSFITYDNHPSPFARFTQFAYAILPSGETIYTEIGQHNNVFSMDETQFSTNNNITNQYSYNLTGQYLYNSNGYPIKINSRDGIVIFSYKSL